MQNVTIMSPCLIIPKIRKKSSFFGKKSLEADFLYKIMESRFFKTTKIMDGVTAIAGLGGELAYLVEGSERALLIDGLAGVGSLKAFVRELTNLPVSIALTHGHIDHNGAAYEYGECYVHPYDIPMQNTRRIRCSCSHGHGRNLSVQSAAPACFD